MFRNQGFRLWRAMAVWVAFAVLVAGCTQSAQPAAPRGGASSSSPAASGGSQPQAAQKQTVKLAIVAPFSGGNARMGLGGRNSAQLALNAATAASKKYNYELVVLDDECKPQSGVQAALKAGSDPSIVGVVAHYCSVVALATAETYHKQGIPAIVWGAVHPDITYGNDFKEVFRVNGTQIQQNQLAAEFAVKTLGFKKFAIIHDTTDYGRGHFKYFKEFAEPLGAQFVSVHGVGPEQQDFTAELTEIKAKNPEVVWFAGLTPVGVRIRTQMDRLGIKAQFQGTSGIMNEEFNTALGAKLAEGSLAFLDGKPTPELPGGKKFMDDYEKAAFKEPPEAYGAFAYVAADLFVRAIESVGPDRAKVTDWLDKNVKNVDTIIGPVNFDKNGQNDVPLVTPHVSQDGKWVPWEKSEYAGGKRKLPGKS